MVAIPSESRPWEMHRLGRQAQAKVRLVQNLLAPARSGTATKRSAARWWVPLVLTCAGLLPAATGLTMTPDGHSGRVLAITSMWLVAHLLLLAGGLLFYAHGLLAGEPATLWYGAALTLLAVHGLPFAVVSLTATQEGDPYPFLRFPLLMLTPALFALLLMGRRRKRPKRVDPLLISVAYAVVVVAVRMAWISVAGGDGTLTFMLPDLGYVVLLAAAGVALSLYQLTLTSIPRWVRGRVLVAGVLFTLGQVLVSLSEGPRTETLLALAVACQFSATLLACCTALELGWRTAEDRSRHGVVLQVRASRAEEWIRAEEERLHEVRATLAGIASASELLRMNPAELPGTTRDRLERMLAAEAARLQRRLSPETEPVADDLVEVGELIEPLVTSIRSRGHEVSWDGAPGWVWGTQDDIAEIVNILLDNAAKHAPGAEIRVSVVTVGDEVGIRVSDTGPGIPAELRETIFDRGAQGPGSRGSGLGLHVAHRMARDLGGRLVLEPQLGPTTFSLMLPAAIPAILDEVVMS